MQAIWSDYGDIKVPASSGGYDIIDPLHDNEPGASLRRWINVPGASGVPGIVDESHIIRLERVMYESARVQWRDSRSNSPYTTWGYHVGYFPSPWPFYKIKQGCHAYTTVVSNPALNEAYKSATMLRVDMPMFAETYKMCRSSSVDWKRYPNNCAVVMLDIAWAHYGKDSSGEVTILTDWKYQQLHFLCPPQDIMLPEYDRMRDEYDLLSYGQLLGTLCPLEPPSYDHTIQWIKIHIYNTGELTMYCPGISVYVDN